MNCACRLASRIGRLMLTTTLTVTLLMAAVVSTAPAQSPPRDRAWLFTYTMRGSVVGNPKDTGAVVFDVGIWRGVVRVTARGSALRALTGERSVLLLRMADSTVVALNPVRQEALVAPATELSGLLGGMPGSMQIDVTDATSVTTARGAGPRLAGFATRRVDLMQRYTLQVGTGTVKRSLPSEQLLELTLSREMDRLDPGFRAFGEYFARSLAMPAAVRRVLRALERDVPLGFPLQSHTTSHTVAGSDTLRAETRSSVSMFRTEAVDTTTFAVPVSYRVTDMSRLLQRRARPSPPATRPP
jgi:hypothetical protein